MMRKRRYGTSHVHQIETQGLTASLFSGDARQRRSMQPPLVNQASTAVWRRCTDPSSLRRRAMKRSNSSRSRARRASSAKAANSRCASSSLRRSASRRSISALRHSSKAALPVRFTPKPPQSARNRRVGEGASATAERLTHRIEPVFAGAAAALHHFVGDDPEADRPVDHEAQHHRQQLERTPTAASSAATPPATGISGPIHEVGTRCGSRVRYRTHVRLQSAGFCASAGTASR